MKILRRKDHSQFPLLKVLLFSLVLVSWCVSHQVGAFEIKKPTPAKNIMSTVIKQAMTISFNHHNDNDGQERLSQQEFALKRQHNDGARKSWLDLTRRQTAASIIMATTGFLTAPATSYASLFEQEPRRQLEFCIVALLRVAYWAERAANDLQSDRLEIRQQRYLEARLACKALVTGKLGGGANYQVYTLNSLQLKGCLSDLVAYAGENNDKNKSQKAQNLQTDLLEALASVVEFDGLETTTDPSPRSSLTLQMYTENKAVFVRRTLAEKVSPNVNELIQLFGPEVENACVAYVQRTYPDELPSRLKQQQEPLDSPSV